MALLWIPVDRSQGTSFIRQIYDQIRLSIVRGDLRAGEQLPSTRQLTRDLSVSRIIIVEVYEQLLAEGYLESRPGSGTYVAEGAYLEATQREHVPSVQTLADPRTENRSVIDFRAGLPALDLFPSKRWGQLGMRVCIESSPSAFGYGHPEGCAELRIALARSLAKTRRVRCHPDQLVITAGAAQALSLVVRLLLSPGEEVIIEDPGTYDVQRIFSAAGATLSPIPVDEDGMQTALLPPEKHPAFVYVTPSHQFPLGGLLPIQRRIQLIQFARTAGCSIVEDDYDSEFRYSGTPVSSLQELEPDRVIYVGTLSKSLSPALRLGYAVLPLSLVERCRRLKQLTDLHSPVMEQLTLARFIEEGYLERHILKMKKIYRKRREALITALTTTFPHSLRVSGDATGLHLIAEFYGRAFTEQTLADLESAGVRLYPVERHAIRKGYHLGKVILGYGNLTQGEIEEGVKRMKTVLDAWSTYPDRNLLWLNILLLMCIVFLPFPTALLGQYPEQRVSVIIYAGTLVLTGLVLQLLWWYATSGCRLVDRTIDPRLVQRATRRNLTAPLLYLLAIGISLFSIPASFVLFMLVPVYYILPGRIDRHWAQRPTARIDEARISPDGDAGPSDEEASHLRKSSYEER